MCETCPAVYHFNCIKPPILNEEDLDDPLPPDWKCGVCIKHEV
jgi:hypothetical protein